MSSGEMRWNDVVDNDLEGRRTGRMIFCCREEGDNVGESRGSLDEGFSESEEGRESILLAMSCSVFVGRS